MWSTCKNVRWLHAIIRTSCSRRQYKRAIVRPPTLPCRATAMDALVALHAEQEAQAQEEDDEDEEEEEEEIEGQAQEGVGGRSSIVLRADGRVRRCTAGRAASRFLPEEIAAQPQCQSKKRPRDDQ